MLTAEDKAQIVKEHQKSGNDTGSAEVQVALLTARIRDLQPHFEANKKDVHSRRGLMLLVAKRRKLLKYLGTKDLEGYRALIKKLGIRG